MLRLDSVLKLAVQETETFEDPWGGGWSFTIRRRDHPAHLDWTERRSTIGKILGPYVQSEVLRHAQAGTADALDMEAVLRSAFDDLVARVRSGEVPPEAIAGIPEVDEARALVLSARSNGDARSLDEVASLLSVQAPLGEEDFGAGKPFGSVLAAWVIEKAQSLVITREKLAEACEKNSEAPSSAA